MIKPETVTAWSSVIEQLVGLGVSSFNQIKPLMQSASVDDSIIMELELKWDTLYDQVKKAAGQ